MIDTESKFQVIVAENREIKLNCNVFTIYHYHATMILQK